MSEVYITTHAEFYNRDYAETVRLAIRQYSPELSPQEGFRREIKRFASLGLDASQAFNDNAKDANIKGAARLVGNGFVFSIHSLGSGAYDFWNGLYELLKCSEISFLVSLVFAEQTGGSSIYFSDRQASGVYHIGEGGELDAALKKAMDEGDVYEVVEELYREGKLVMDKIETCK
jgi:hypothetical protein